MGADIHLTGLFVYIDGLHIVRAKPLFLGIISIFPGTDIVIIHTPVIRPYPQIARTVFGDATDDIIIQRISFGRETDMAETLTKRMIVIQSAKVSTQPHASLRVHKDTPDRALRKAPVLAAVAGIYLKPSGCLIVNIQRSKCPHP